MKRGKDLKKLGVIIILLGMSAFCFEMDQKIQEKQELEKSSLVKDVETDNSIN